jgi:hypothetical protein
MSVEETNPTLPSARLLVLAGFLLAGGGLLLGYGVGNQKGMSTQGASVREVADLRSAVTSQKTAIDVLNRTLSTTVQERDIAVESGKELHTKITAETDARALADSRLAIYQTLLAERGGIALTIRGIDIKPLPEGAFEYHIDLMQLKPNLRAISGSLEMRLVNGETVVAVPLAQSRFNLETFEQLTGRWTMPSGFSPQYLDITVQGAGQVVKQRYAWERGEVIRDMPATLADVPPLPTAADDSVKTP